MFLDQRLHFSWQTAEVRCHIVKCDFNARSSWWSAGVERRQIIEIFVCQVAIWIEIGMLEKERSTSGEVLYHRCALLNRQLLQDTAVCQALRRFWRIELLDRHQETG